MNRTRIAAIALAITTGASVLTAVAPPPAAHAEATHCAEFLRYVEGPSTDNALSWRGVGVLFGSDGTTYPSASSNIDTAHGVLKLRIEAGRDAAWSIRQEGTNKILRSGKIFEGDAWKELGDGCPSASLNAKAVVVREYPNGVLQP